MKKDLFLPAVLSLFLLVPASITWAQTITSQKGLTTAIFNLPQGMIKVYLPDDIRPGDRISGSLIAEPAGKNEKQALKNRAELNGYAVTICNTVFSAANAGKPISFSVPLGSPTVCRIVLTSAAGIKTPGLTAPTIPENLPSPAPDACNIPSHALAGSPMRITGPFDGDAANTRCTLGSKPMEVLAESPRSCIVNYPPDAGGPNTVNINESGKPPCSRNVSGVDMELKPGKLNLMRGEKTTLDVKISGLEGLPDTARLKVTNTSPEVIRMTGGITTQVSIPPSSSNTGGVYARRFDIESIKTGNFTVNVNLDLPETGPVATTPASDPPKLPYLRLKIDGADISVSANGEHLETKPKEEEQVHIQGNTIRIFFNGLFQAGFDLSNSGERSVQELIE